jgi:hypothetical protein
MELFLRNWFDAVTSGLLGVLQTAGIAVSLATGPAALFFSWQNNRENSRVTSVASTQLQVSVMPVPMIEGSRLTWRSKDLVMLSIRIRNVGSGPTLNLRLRKIHLHKSAIGFKRIETPALDVVMPTGYVDYKIRFSQPPGSCHENDQLLLEMSYFDVLGNSYSRSLSLLVSVGAGAGTVAGVLPVKIKSLSEED